MMFIAFAAATFMFASCHTGNNKNDDKQGTDDTTIVATEAEANADTTATGNQTLKKLRHPPRKLLQRRLPPRMLPQSKNEKVERPNTALPTNAVGRAFLVSVLIMTYSPPASTCFLMRHLWLSVSRRMDNESENVIFNAKSLFSSFFRLFVEIVVYLQIRSKSKKPKAATDLASLYRNSASL